VPFLRISRDKRGYEYFALVHTTSGRRGKVRQRILYWFRTPPNVKVGRTAFDEEVIRALEAQYPDVTFDWDALRSTPMPPPSVEHWRERRRAERAIRQSLAADDHEEPVENQQIAAAAAPDDASFLPDTIQVGPSTGAEQQAEVTDDESYRSAEAGALLQPDMTPSPQPSEGPGLDPRRRRRRRRGRRGRAAGQPPVSGSPEPGQTQAAAPSSIENDSEELFDAVPGEDDGE
jgi:hypothetical protein